MLFPTADQYSKLIEEKAPGTWYALGDYHFHPTAPGNSPPYIHGKSCLIFKAEKNGQQFAVRCFINVDPDTLNRYDEVCSYLAARKLSWKTDCVFLAKEIRFEGEQYPAVKMEWVHGVTLNRFIDRIVSDPARLSRLQHALVALSNNLEQNGIGHGDLNFSHIMITGDPTEFTIKLVDYDTMFIPTFGGQNSTVSGTPGFQHPARLASDYSETIDRFSIWVLLTGLEAIKQDLTLWTQPEKIGYRSDENMLFTFRDLLNPEKSRLFQHLASYKNEVLRYYVNQLETFCNATSLDEVTRPEIYKGPARTPGQEEIKTGIAIPQKYFNVEIKTIPAGRDVLVNGTKKGITPLRLSLAKEDFEHVEVLDAWERTPLQINEQVQTYEIDLLKKRKEDRQTSSVEEPEIIDFSADHYSVMEGGIVSIRWKVKGNGRIHIEPIGDVTEKSGSREFVVNNTTLYELSIGNVTRSFSVHVQPKKQQKYLRSKMQTKPSKTERDAGKGIGTRWWIVIAIILLLSIAAYFLYPQLSGKAAENNASQFSLPATSSMPLFSADAVKNFLNGLYGSYNKRNLAEMVNHYAEPMDEYYDSKSISADSLSGILKNLFITPSYYSCTPDFSTLQITPQGDNCSVKVQITEVLQKDANSSRDTFHTKIAYVINGDYRIVSEKGVE